MNYLQTHTARVLALLAAHLELVALALVVALAIALPLGIVATRAKRQAPLLLGTLGAIYTIPSLALLALLVQAVGLGPLPIFIALVAYAQFMLVRNVVAGIESVDPAVRDAALGLGMSTRQSLLRVELPLAAPVILGGVRIAAVAMVALATLGGYVGASGLGTLIFTGLAIHHNDEILAGSIAVSALAIAIDLALRGCEKLLHSYG
ncbi:MAG: ABC transporter permease [Candidatus Eremiobacteraeota bacterium]|nr:ABC transporter permease [Candidatus Eremiobacteraeota bacterium]